MRFLDLKTDVSAYLTDNVGAEYCYHNLDHTLQVLSDAERISDAESLDDNSRVLVQTAALLHDVGYVGGRERHEDRSCAWARENLARYGYEHQAIEAICRIIGSTRVPQSPVDQLSKIVCDADLATLGGTEYRATAARMREEYRFTQPDLTDQMWPAKQIEFIEQHSYHTQSARNMFDAQKAANLQQLRANAVVDTLGGGADKTQPASNRSALNEHGRDLALTLAGVVIASVALKDFLVPNRFFDGGVTGLSLLVHELNHWSLGLLIVLFNVPMIIAAHFSAGSRFAMRMLAGVVMLGVCLEVMPSIPATGDKLLVSVFGGALLGIGVGLVMRAGAALDGIEVLALYTLRRTSFTIAEIILGINIMIFVFAGFAFGIETALYSILTYFSASRCIDYMVEGLEAFTGVTIISAKSEEIKHQLVNNLGRGITVYKGERGFLPGSYHVSTDCDIIFTVITRLELRKLKNLIAEVDPNAFVFASAIKDTSGGIISRKHHH
ncbi:MAG: DUF2179 domain-containing protein [Candidatus Kapabacteria bacterium]|nr:DUF2179 domain-containing protein [Candidatus Kapabacteria bacterium]